MSYNAKDLLNAEYATHLPDHAFAAPRSAVATPSDELVDSIEAEAVKAGVPAGAVDWSAIVPLIIQAITTKNPLGLLNLIPILMPVAGAALPQVVAFLQQLFANFHKQPPATGPTITGH